MRKILKNTIALFILVLLAWACSKDNLTALSLTIVNTANSPVSNASVTLYKTLSDLQGNTNIQDIQISDNNGNLTFQFLSPNVYFFNVYRSTDCSTNAFTTNTTASLTSGKTNSQTVTVNQIGQETFSNTSTTNQYSIVINNTPFQTVNIGSMVTANLIVGTYTIHIIPVTTGTAKDTVITIIPCGSNTLSFQ